MNPLKKRYNQRKNKAVAPVLATLLMIAVAVAMSVIIFMWSQGFLAQTSESTGSQQGSQNQAAQSSIAIETVTGTPTSGTVGSNTTTLTVLARNVGAIAINVGSLTITGLSSNTRFNGSLIAIATGDTTMAVTSSPTGGWAALASAEGLEAVSKGGGIIITLTGTNLGPKQNQLAPGDVVTVKLTTDKGTFAQSSFTVP